MLFHEVCTLPTTDFCTAYDADRVCTECQANFQLDGNNRCVYIADTVCILTEGVCTGCAPGFEFVTDHCEFTGCLLDDCSKCIPGYTLSNGDCLTKTLPAGCSAWDSNEQFCETCASGYDFHRGYGICVPAACADDPEHCTECLSSCAECNYLTGVCNTCQGTCFDLTLGGNLWVDVDDYACSW